VEPAELVTLGILLIALIGVLWRPLGIKEWIWTSAAAAIVLLAGFLSLEDAESTVSDVVGVLAFLVGVAVVAELTSSAGVFAQAAYLMAKKSQGKPTRLFMLVFALTAFATSIFSLDGAVVVMTPVVVHLAAMAGVQLMPLAFTVVFVANCGSLLFPVSNLTNLLAVQQLNISFFDYTSRMWLPSLLVLVATWVVLRLWFRRSFSGTFTVEERPTISDPVVFRAGVVVCVAMLPAFFVAGILGFPVEVVALSAALILGLVFIIRGRSARSVAATVPWQVVFFVVGLFLVVAAARDNGLGSQIGDLMAAIAEPTLGAGVATTGVAAALANVVNNLPAYLIIAPAATGDQIYNVLVGVNAGPMLTPLGSLATVLWLHLLGKHKVEKPSTLDIAKIGLVATPPILLAGVIGLWLTVTFL
jgi:arsenical pump membrane protein